MKRQLVSLHAVAAWFTAAGTALAIPPYATLDYAGQATSASILFVPLLGSEPGFREGITFYSTYYNEVSTPLSWGPGMKSVNVSVRPTAHRGDAAEYQSFFLETDRVDRQENWFNASNPCSFSTELLGLLGTLPDEFSPQLYAGGYPDACSATIYYLTSVEASVLGLLQQGRGLVLADSLPLCQSSSPVFDTRPVVEALVDAGVLTGDSWQLEGEYAAIVSALSGLDQSVYGAASGSPRSARRAFLRDALIHDGASEMSILREGYDDARLTACIAAPLTIHSGP